MPVGREAWIVPSLNQGQLWGQTRLLMALSCLVFKTSKDRDCTNCMSSMGCAAQLSSRETSSPLYPGIKIQGVAYRATKHPEEESIFVAKFRSRFLNSQLHLISNGIYAVLLTESYCYPPFVDNIKKSCSCQSSGARSEWKQFGIENSWCSNKSWISTNLGLLDLFTWHNGEYKPQICYICPP